MEIFHELINSLDKLPVPREVFFLIELTLAAALLFWGKKIIRFWLALTGIALGTYSGVLLIFYTKLSAPLTWIVLGLLAFAGAALMALAYRACFFVGGSIAALYLGHFLLGVVWPGYNNYILLGFAVVCGLLAVFLKDHFAIVATAISGALLAGDVLIAYLYKFKPGTLLSRASTLSFSLSEDLIMLLALALIAAIGVWRQYKHEH